MPERELVTQGRNRLFVGLIMSGMVVVCLVGLIVPSAEERSEVRWYKLIRKTRR